MLSLTDRASIERAQLDDDLRLLIDRLTDTTVFVVQGGDAPEVIDQALGFSISADFDWIKDHGRWFEIAYGSTRVFVENGPATELGIHYLCLSYFWVEK